MNFDEDTVVFIEPKPIVLSGESADEMVHMVLSPAPNMSPVLKRAAELYRETFIDGLNG
jgi:hypothetical protein